MLEMKYLYFQKMSVLAHEKVWLDKTIYTDAERNYYESLSKVSYVWNNGNLLKIFVLNLKYKY